MDNLNVSDELWARIQPLLPVVQRRHRWPGRRRIDDRTCLNGILFILVTGIGWQQLPQQLGYGSGMTCWRRLRDLADHGNNGCPRPRLARSAIAVRLPGDDSRVTAEDRSLDQPCRPTLVMSCRARTRHTYNGTRRDGRMM